MVGCLQALGLCRRKRRVNEAPVDEKKSQLPGTEDSSKDELADPEKPPLKEEAVDAPRAASSRANANQTPNLDSLAHGSKSKEDQVDDPEEEAARKRRAEEEEQERLDFFQMM